MRDLRWILAYHQKMEVLLTGWGLRGEFAVGESKNLRQWGVLSSLRQARAGELNTQSFLKQA